MCGILGGNNPNWLYEDGLSIISHRGPDHKKIFKSEKLTMGFARLAIIDLSEKAIQPMWDSSNSVCITFNE